MRENNKITVNDGRYKYTVIDRLIAKDNTVWGIVDVPDEYDDVPCTLCDVLDMIIDGYLNHDISSEEYDSLSLQCTVCRACLDSNQCLKLLG